MTESNASTGSESDGNGWETYTREFGELMIRSIDTFNETVHQLFPDDNNNDNATDNFHIVMVHSKKAFRNKLKRYLNIVYGMQRGKRHDYL